MGRISCPHCQALVQSDAAAVGQAMKCGQCRRTFLVQETFQDNDPASDDTDAIPFSILILMLAAGHLLGLLLLVVVFGFAATVVILGLIAGGEIVVWRRRQIAAWLQQTWQSIQTQRRMSREQRLERAQVQPLVQPEIVEVVDGPATHSHPDYAVQREAIDWARRVLRGKHRYVILDTETTGLDDRDEIIQLAVIDVEGNVLFNGNIRPSKKKSISPGATRVHGITMPMLSGCPTFSQIAKQLKKAIGNRDIITYNAKFDMRLYEQSLRAAGEGFLPTGQWECAMLNYAEFVGEWNDYYGNYKWHKLPGGDHTALGDCQATLRLIRTMAATTKSKRQYEFWVGR